jgi:hypothetical protein
MHDTDTNAPSPQPGALREEAVTSLPHKADKEAPAVSAAAAGTRAPSLLRRLLECLARLFKGKKRKETKYVPDQAASERAAAAQAAQLPPPMAFKGDTANTLATPIGAYAGKPVEQALRKRAEQQFKSMDITQSTVH